MIILPLTHVIAISLKKGVVPSDLKVAKVLPMVNVRVLNHLNVNNILYKHQMVMKTHFDIKAKKRQFQPGDIVLMLLPLPGAALSA